MRFFVAALWLASLAAEDLHKEGANFYAQKKYLEAIAALEQAVKSEDPKSAAFTESALMIGQSYFMLSQAPKSIPWLEKIPASPEANYMLGYAYLQTHELEQSHLAFSRLFGLPPTSAGAYLVSGQMLLKKEYETEALGEVQKAVALNPNLPEAHFILGEIAISRHLFDEGVAEMGKEIEVNPNFSMAWYRLGEVLTRQERCARNPEFGARHLAERGFQRALHCAGEVLFQDRELFKCGRHPAHRVEARSEQLLRYLSARTDADG